MPLPAETFKVFISHATVEDGNLVNWMADALDRLHIRVYAYELYQIGGQTIFETKEQVLSFISSKEYPFSLPNLNVPKDARQKFIEAELCYFAPAVRAASIMLRASLESALTEKGVIKGTLEEQIEEALSAVKINKREYTLAHGTRLAGNESVHQSSVIKPVEVQGLFGAVTQILNRLFNEG